MTENNEAHRDQETGEEKPGNEERLYKETVALYEKLARLQVTRPRTEEQEKEMGALLELALQEGGMEKYAKEKLDEEAAQ